MVKGSGREASAARGPTRLAPLDGSVLPALWLKCDWRYALQFSSYAAVLLAVYYYPYAEHVWLDAYLRGYAATAGGLLQLVEPSVRVVGQDIVGRFALRIVRTCDAMDVQILVASALLALRAPLVRRLAAIFMSTALIALGNVARICALYFIGAASPGRFEFFHLEVLPLVVLCWSVAAFLALSAFVFADVSHVE